MQSRIKKLLTLAMLVSPMLCYADASYEKSTQITGGQLVDMLKSYAMISKQMKSLTDPKSEITMVHGNQKAIVSKDYTEITDLDKEVIIHIDDQELSLAEFGRLLSVHAGWGMRIAFVPEEFITESPTIKMRKPQRRKRRTKR